MGARALNAVLGLWLFFTPFIWAQTPIQRWNAWVVGILAVTDALGGLWGEMVGRYLNATLGAWLILSALFLRHGRSLTFWNEIAVGFGMAFVAAARSLGDLRGRRPSDVRGGRAGPRAPA